MRLPRVVRVVRGSRDARKRDGVAVVVPEKTRARELPDERREVVRDARPGLRRERVRGGCVPLRLGASARALGGARARSLPRRLDGRVRATDGLEARARAPWLAVSPLVPGARAGVSAPTSSSPREARDGIDRTASTRLDASAGSASAGFPRAGAMPSNERGATI